MLDAVHRRLRDKSFLINQQERIRNEARGLCRCQAAGIAVPTLFHADLHGRLLVTAKIEGLTLKQLLYEAEREGDFEKIENLLTQVNRFIL